VAGGEVVVVGSGVEVVVVSEAGLEVGDAGAVVVLALVVGAGRPSQKDSSRYTPLYEDATILYSPEVQSRSSKKTNPFSGRSGMVSKPRRGESCLGSTVKPSGVRRRRSSYQDLIESLRLTISKSIRTPSVAEPYDP
jgi:hypothetical protein